MAGAEMFLMHDGKWRRRNKVLMDYVIKSPGQLIVAGSHFSSERRSSFGRRLLSRLGGPLAVESSVVIEWERLRAE
ncbi:unnamed protein product [Heligmosomoides polygyrus]|uniref:Hydrolase n=1 Tax=Heligmosomoides polygyrus TaxID=6339 RepID=A0A183FQ57_HELPZ|nr:unnamed protein product [Heligmosomoides polygyrus]